jgi:hypothetical protein
MEGQVVQDGSKVSSLRSLSFPITDPNTIGLQIVIIIIVAATMSPDADERII